MNHDQALAQRGSVGHRMRDHHGRELLLADNLLGEPDDLLGAPGSSAAVCSSSKRRSGRR